jgi:hypothetical protein
MMEAGVHLDEDRIRAIRERAAGQTLEEIQKMLPVQ